MISYHHTLALIDTHSQAQFALNKALLLARKTKAKVTALKVDRVHNNFLSKLGLIPNDALDPMLYIDKLIAKYVRQGVDIEVKTRKNVKEHEAILDEVDNGNYDLVIVNNQHHNSVLSEFLQSCESHLLRDCVVPVMIVGNKNWRRQGHILTALEIDEKNQHHNALNRCLLDETLQLASLLENDIHLLNCYQAENWNMAVTRNKNVCSLEEQKQHHWINLVDSAKPYQLQDDHLHLEQGLPDHVIPLVAEQCDASMVILGAGEHHGFMSELKGHTSAVVVDQLKCDILAVKPALNYSS